MPEYEVRVAPTYPIAPDHCWLTSHSPRESLEPSMRAVRHEAVYTNGVLLAFDSVSVVFRYADHCFSEGSLMLSLSASMLQMTLQMSVLPPWPPMVMTP